MLYGPKLLYQQIVEVFIPVSFRVQRVKIGHLICLPLKIMGPVTVVPPGRYHYLVQVNLVRHVNACSLQFNLSVGTTGGFAPMIDAAAIQGITLYTGGYLGQYPERLSSVTEIRTLDTANPIVRMEADVGIEGFGGLAEKALHGGDLLVSAHHGILEMFEGALGSLPSYTNELTRYRRNSASGNRLTLLQIAGWDSFQFTPCATDMDTTSTIDSQYSGWRETTGPRSRPNPWFIFSSSFS